MIDKISDAKKLLEKTKHNYFESSKDVVEQEEKIIKLSEKNKIKEDEMIHLRDNLVKLQKKSEGECENYKKELEKINNFFEEYEKKYNELIGTFQHFIKFFPKNKKIKKNFAIIWILLSIGLILKEMLPYLEIVLIITQIKFDSQKKNF